MNKVHNETHDNFDEVYFFLCISLTGSFSEEMKKFHYETYDNFNEVYDAMDDMESSEKEVKTLNFDIQYYPKYNYIVSHTCLLYTSDAADE